MKTLIACFLLSIVGLSYATPYLRYPYVHKLKFPYTYQETALLESLASSQQGQLSEAEGEDDIADLQALFNVLEQVETEKAKAMDDKSVKAQFWKQLRRTLWSAGKKYVRNRYCYEEQNMKAMLQELTGQHEMQDESNEVTAEEDDRALAELQSMFSALKNIEAKMQDGAMAEGLFKKIRKFLKKGTKRFIKSYLC